jgi:EmrB/QacA subfamily drug resistance transporter
VAEETDGEGQGSPQFPAGDGVTGPGVSGSADPVMAGATGQPGATGARPDRAGSASAGSANGSAGDGSAGTEHYADRREVMIVLPGLLMAILLAMLDQLIVGTALPRIVGSLGGVTHLAWVVTAYVLASTVTTPFYGKLGDMYGRKKLFIFAIVIFLVGSALSGLSQNMAQLIGFRALQGLGAGGLMVGAMATLGDIVAPRERGRYMSYMMVVMMLATIGGPLVGGFITDSFSWRWIFYINLPLGGAALIYLLAVLHVPAKKVSHKIDYLGGGLLAVAAVAVILFATFGGSEYAWGSVQIIGLGVIAVAATAGFLVTETRAAEPILPLHVFRNRNFSVTMALTFLTGLAMFGAMTFLPLYQQTVQGASAVVSGLMLTPMMVGVTITSIVSGQITTRTGRYKLFPVMGGAIMAVGMFLLTRLGVDTSRTTSGIYYVVLGLGMGFLMQMVSLIAQNSVGPRDMGVASSARMFFQQIGGSLGVSAFGAIFATRLTGSLRAAAGSGVHINASGGQLDPTVVDRLTGPIRHDVFYAIAHAVQGVFFWAAPSAVLIFLLALLIKEVPLRGRTPAPGAGGADQTAGQQPELVS